MYPEGELVMACLDYRENEWTAGIVLYYIREYNPADNMYVLLVDGCHHTVDRRYVVSAKDWEKEK